MKNVSVRFSGYIASITHVGESDAIVLAIRGHITELPRIVFSGDAREQIKGLKKGDHVDITGTVDASLASRKTAKGNVSIHRQRIIGRSIVPTISETMRYFGEDFGTYRSENLVIAAGALKILQKDEKRIRISINPSDGTEGIRMSCYNPSLITRINAMEEGQQVRVLAEIQTKLVKATETTKRRVNENIIISNIF